jgi:hypothetical protein
MFKNILLVALILIVTCLIAWPKDTCEASLEVKKWSKDTYEAVSSKLGYHQDTFSSRGHKVSSRGRR